ncbi:MAG: hypothetical protein AAFP87_11610 [Pseudomonadota bacterium]
MTQKPIRLGHTAPYSWFAMATDSAGKSVIGETHLPILRVRNDDETRNFEPQTGRYRDTIHISRAVDRPDWWQEAGAQMDKWRAGLIPGKLVALRLFKENGTKNGSTGNWLDVYEVKSATLTDTEINVMLVPQRKWNVKS